MIRRARSYVNLIMNLNRGGGLDKALIVILCSVEALSIKNSAIMELKRIQYIVGRFILLVPASTINLSESHIIFQCPVVTKLRRDFYIFNFMPEFKAKGPLPNVRVLRAYLGGDGSTGQTLMVRGRKLGKMTGTCITAVHEPH